MANPINTSDFRKAARALKKAQPMLYKEVARSVTLAASLVASDAKVIAGEHSESIPPTIRKRRRGLAAEVVAGGPQTPIAGLYEKGNKGGSKGDTFRHPVYGRDVWVQQPRYPFLAPSGRKNKAKIDALVIGGCERVRAFIINGE